MKRPETWHDLERMAPPWERGKREHIFNARIFNLEKLPSKSPETGAMHEFYVLSATDWINVVAITPDDNMIFVVQQRHGIDRATMEIPAGLVDPGEEPEKAALRELEEETGYVPGEIIHIGTSYSNPAFLNNRSFSYLARNCRPTGKIDRDPSEELKVVLVPSSEFYSLLLRGMLGNSSGILGLFWYDLHIRGMRWEGDGNMTLGPAVSRLPIDT